MSLPNGSTAGQAITSPTRPTLISAMRFLMAPYCVGVLLLFCTSSPLVNVPICIYLLFCETHCRLMAALMPGSVESIAHRDGLSTDSPSAQHQLEVNVQSFRGAAASAGVPEHKLLSSHDFSRGKGGPAAVRECLLSLRSVFGGKVPRMRRRRKQKSCSFDGNSTGSNAAADRRNSTGVPSTTRSASSCSNTLPTPSNLGNGTGDGHPTSQPPSGNKSLSKDMRQMFNQGVRKVKEQFNDPPAEAIDSIDGSIKIERIVSPILEHVLSKITHEYETRLLKKENDLASTREELLEMSKERRKAQKEIMETKEEFEMLRTQLSQRNESRRGSGAYHGDNEDDEMAPAAFADPETLSAVLEGLRFQRRSMKNFRESVYGIKAEVLQQLQAQKESHAQLRRQLDNLVLANENTLRKATKYNVVAQENRRLYNEIQEMRGNIRVLCRIRPLLSSRNGASNEEQAATAPLPGEPDGLFVDCTEGEGRKRRKTFKYNRVFGPNAQQKEVYEELQPLVRSVCDGYSACIFAYGQTGSGKTYTMTGDGDGDSRGIIWRALEDLFSYKRERADDVHYDISVQMLEIYNEQVRDLLCKPEEDGRVEVRFGKGHSTVPGLESHKVKDEQDIVACMDIGFRNRFTATTKMNDVSSRSHSITLVNVSGNGFVSGMEHVKSNASLYLIDLAGSERITKSEASGERLKEAQYINKSLSALGDVMSALQYGEKHIPFRNSKLTSILQGPLCNRGKAMMFAHVNPHNAAMQETLSTLQFADRVSSVALGKAASNTESKQMSELNEKVSRLERELINYKQENARLLKQQSHNQQHQQQISAAHGQNTAEGDSGAAVSGHQHALYRKLKRPPTLQRSIQRTAGATAGTRPTSAPPQPYEERSQVSTTSVTTDDASSSSTGDPSENKENEDAYSNAAESSSAERATDTASTQSTRLSRRANSKIPRPPNFVNHSGGA